MITYKSCTDVPMKQIYDAFSLGFSDYMIQMNISQELFETRFFGPEGNSIKHSFIAIDHGEPVGLILGGIRIFDGLKTMRCGTLCIAPTHRGFGISQKLFELHREDAINEGCKQLFLEVIKGNDRAIRFYENSGYTKTYKLKYYSGMLDAIPSAKNAASVDIKHSSFVQLKAVRDKLVDCHINWQSDVPYYESIENVAYFSAFEQAREIATISMSPQGKIYFLWVEPAYRNKGIGSMLVQSAALTQKVDKVTICLPNNASLEGFFRKLKFQKDALEQYEMNFPI